MNKCKCKCILANFAHWPLSTIMAFKSPFILIGMKHEDFVSSIPINWCVVGILVHYGCRRIIQFDAARWW